MAIVKWTDLEYKVLITKGRLKKYTVIAWMDKSGLISSIGFRGSSS